VLEVFGDGARADADRPRYGHVGPPGGRQLQHLHLPAGEVGHAAGLDGHCGNSPVPRGRTPQRVGHRRRDGPEHRAVLMAELPARPAQRDADHLAIARARHGERELVVGRDMTEILGIDPEPAKSLPADDVADLGRSAAAGPLADHQRVLGQVGLEDLDRGRVQAAPRVFGVHAEDVRLGIHFLVCRDITADQPRQSGQQDFGRCVRLAQF
jgi:hypothetical protein